MSGQLYSLVQQHTQSSPATLHNSNPRDARHFAVKQSNGPRSRGRWPQWRALPHRRAPVVHHEVMERSRGESTVSLTAAEALQSIGMDKDTARATLAAADLCEQQSLGPEDGPNEFEAAEINASVPTQGAARSDSYVRVNSDAVNPRGWDSVSGSPVEATGQLDARRVQAQCQALLDIGVPISQLPALLSKHPAALLAVPDQDWAPKVCANTADNPCPPLLSQHVIAYVYNLSSTN